MKSGIRSLVLLVSLSLCATSVWADSPEGDIVEFEGWKLSNFDHTQKKSGPDSISYDVEDANGVIVPRTAFITLSNEGAGTDITTVVELYRDFDFVASVQIDYSTEEVLMRVESPQGVLEGSAETVLEDPSYTSVLDPSALKEVRGLDVAIEALKADYESEFDGVTETVANPTNTQECQDTCRADNPLGPGIGRSGRYSNCVTNAQWNACWRGCVCNLHSPGFFENIGCHAGVASGFTIDMVGCAAILIGG